MIVVTGATGKLGRHVIHELLKTVPPAQIVATVRNPDKAADLSALGVQVREADYEKSETLRTAFAGAEKVLLISSNEIGKRVPQHQAAIKAAQSAGATLLAYTSILRADASSLLLAGEHKATEAVLQASGLPFVFLRNGWYLENYTEQMGSVLQQGTLLGAAGNGRFAAAARADYAAAAAAVLMGTGHENKIYELAGDTSFTLTEFADEAAKQSGKPVTYRNLSPDEYRNTLVGFGLPAPLAEALADSDRGAAQGELDSTSRDLSTLTGRPTTPLSDAIATALRAQVG